VLAPPKTECSDSSLAAGHEVDSDLAIMQAIAKGDETALSMLLLRYEQDVRRIVGRLTAWSSDVDDLVQDVFVKAWLRAKTYSGHGSLRGWLLQLALNRCRNHHRTTKRLWRNAMRLAVAGRIGTAQAELVEDHRWSLVQHALTQLTYKDRELLVLVYMEQHEIRTLAKQWAVSESTLHVRLHRARKRILKLIEVGKST
jgi:RNA polymerase sigma-70 factor, ECF subfamily